MDLFVANSTQQRVEFHYSVPEQEKRRSVTIEPLTQVRLPDRNLSSDQVDAIVKQHARYGMVSVDEVSKSRAPGMFRGLCYSIDKPVLSAKIETLLRTNYLVLEEQGRQLRREAAIAGNAALERTMQNAAEAGQVPRGEAAPARFEATVQHDTKSSDDMGDSKPVAEGWKSGGKK